MMPGMFFRRTWDRVSYEWLVSRTASRLFGAASALTVATTPLQLGLVKPLSSSLTSWMNLLFAIFGAAGGLSIVFLWGGMWRHWLLSNPPSRMTKRIWFCVLLFGLWWGAVLYYLMAYLRYVEKTEPAPTLPHSKGRVTKVFGYVLLVGWMGLFSFVALIFAFPKSVGPLLHPIADFFVLIPTFLLLGTALYGVMRLYGVGMNRA